MPKNQEGKSKNGLNFDGYWWAVWYFEKPKKTPTKCFWLAPESVGPVQNVSISKFLSR